MYDSVGIHFPFLGVNSACNLWRRLLYFHGDGADFFCAVLAALLNFRFRDDGLTDF